MLTSVFLSSLLRSTSSTSTHKDCLCRRSSSHHKLETTVSVRLVPEPFICSFPPPPSLINHYLSSHTHLVEVFLLYKKSLRFDSFWRLARLPRAWLPTRHRCSRRCFITSPGDSPVRVASSLLACLPLLYVAGGREEGAPS